MTMRYPLLRVHIPLKAYWQRIQRLQKEKQALLALKIVFFFLVAVYIPRNNPIFVYSLKNINLFSYSSVIRAKLSTLNGAFFEDYYAK